MVLGRVEELPFPLIFVYSSWFVSKKQRMFHRWCAAVARTIHGGGTHSPGSPVGSGRVSESGSVGSSPLSAHMSFSSVG